MTKWDLRYLQLCDVFASWSKDPSTKVGAVIVQGKNSLVSAGYNGFPKGMVDNEELYSDRDIKLQYIVHAEVNAVLNAAASVKGCTLYTNVFSCTDCAKIIIQSGITRVVSWELDKDSKWYTKWLDALAMYRSANVEVTLYARLL